MRGFFFADIESLQGKRQRGGSGEETREDVPQSVEIQTEVLLVGVSVALGQKSEKELPSS